MFFAVAFAFVCGLCVGIGAFFLCLAFEHWCVLLCLAFEHWCIFLCFAFEHRCISLFCMYVSSVALLVFCMHVSIVALHLCLDETPIPVPVLAGEGTPKASIQARTYSFCVNSFFLRVEDTQHRYAHWS